MVNGNNPLFCDEQFLNINKAYSKMTSQINSAGNGNSYQSLLTYYKDKVDALEQEREAWLAKLDECGSRIAQKQQKQQKLRELKGQHAEVDSDIVHHTVARFDEELSSLLLDRHNQNLQFEQAEQLIKLRELAEEYPIIADKCLPCVTFFEGDVINNELNIHNRNGKIPARGEAAHEYVVGKNGLKVKKQKQEKSQQQYAKGSNLKKQQGNKSGEKLGQKKSLQQIMKMQVIETQKLNDKQIYVMEEQKKVLEQSIAKLKQRRVMKNEVEKKIVKQFTKKHTQLQKKHNELAEKYFSLRRDYKQKGSSITDESKKLKSTFETLEDKISVALHKYEKDNKARQALILRKSGDFQEDYKAKMRAKQRNLQALKENYEKMQQLCIEKVRKLEATVEKAKFQLQDAQQRRRFLVDDLREQLKQLQKRVSQQRIQKAKIDLRMKQKMNEEKEQEQQIKLQQEKQKRQREREELLKSAYQKTRLPLSKKRPQSKSTEKEDDRTRQLSKEKKKDNERKQNKKRKANNAQSSGDDDSLDISDVQNIRKQITELEKKIARDEQDN